jgi:DNA invertase Pin-like site-specific DNA recombinase
MIAAYVRVSSLTQNLATQRDAIQRAAAARGDTDPDGAPHFAWFEEKISAKTMKRPELERLRELVRQGAVSRLYVFRLDRLSRSGIRDTFEIIEECREHRCELVSIADGFDLAGPAADVIIAVMAWAAKQERIVRNERIAAARTRLEAAGEPWGRPRRMTGAQVTTAKKMKARGESVRTIAAALGVPRATVGRELAR